MLKVAIDAGHGLNTPGKRTPDDEREWKFNDTVVLSFIKELSLFKDVTIRRFDDPTGTRDVSLTERSDGANQWGADIYISFHHNAYTGTWGDWSGVETYIAPIASTKSIELANAVHPSVVKGYGLRDRGIKRGDYHIIRETKMPAILIEGGFMDSRIDIVKLRDKSVLQNAGKLIAQAVANHFKLIRKQTDTTPKAEETNKSNPQLLNDTARKEAREEIKRAVADGRFSSKHPNVDNYDDKDLLSYALIALLRFKNK